MAKIKKAVKKVVKKASGYKVNLKDLLEAGCHFGHQARRWNPKMDEYIFVKREGVHIFDLEITARKLEEAMNYVRDLVKEGKEVVFVGTKRQASAVIREAAERCGAPYVANRWLGGTITNWDEIKGRIDLLKELTEKKDKGEFKKYTKKENILIDRDISRLTRFLGGLKNLKKIPEAVFIVDVKKEVAVIREGKIKDVRTIGMVDTNCEPDGVDYIIPVNDDAVSSITLVVDKIAQAYQDGKNLQKK